MIKNSNITRWVYSVAIASTIVSLVLAVMIVGAEEYPMFKDWLRVTFYHHWLGKSTISLGLFIIVSALFRFKSKVPRLATIVAIEAVAVIFSVFIIASFFLLHVLKIV